MKEARKGILIKAVPGFLNSWFPYFSEALHFNRLNGSEISNFKLRNHSPARRFLTADRR
jgi:hypothetical protein